MSGTWASSVPTEAMVDNPANPHTIQSKLQSLELFQSNYNSTFPVGLPTSSNVTQPHKHSGWQMNPSNTMFGSGEFDPWRSLSHASTDIEVGAPGRQTSQNISACNIGPHNSSIFSIIYRDMVHVLDMRALLNTNDVNH